MRFPTSALLALALSLAALTPSEAHADEPSAQDRGAARRLFEAGKQAFRAEQYDDAARLFAEAYAKDPSLRAALFNQAFALRSAKRYAEAREAYERYLALQPGDLETLFALARTAELAGDLEDARKHYEAYLAGETRPERARHVAHAKAQLERLAAAATSPAPPEPAGPEAPAPAEAPPVVAAPSPPPAAEEPTPSEPAAPVVPRVAHAFWGPNNTHRPRLVRVAKLPSLEETARPTTEPAPPPALAVEALLEDGEARLAARDAEGALRAFQRALAAAPSSARPHWGLARAYELAGQNRAAKHHYRLYRDSAAADREKEKADAAWWKIESLPETQT